MKLVINLPENKDGMLEFNKKFARLQSELFMIGIRKLNLNSKEKKKLISILMNKISD